MVEPGETKVKAEEGEERKYPAKFNKKKHGKNNNSKCVDRDRDVPELLKGIEFSFVLTCLYLYSFRFPTHTYTSHTIHIHTYTKHTPQIEQI